MHRSRAPLLVIFAAVAACSSPEDSNVNELLAQDTTLIAGLDKAPEVSLPNECGTASASAQPAADNRSRAQALTRQAYDAELLGNLEEARALLQRAAKLDGTDRSAAYHLGRTYEALGDDSEAMTAYCRFLTLAPTAAESVEARQRVATLAQRDTRMTSAGTVSANTATARRAPVVAVRPVTRQQPAAGARVAAARVEQPARTRSSGRGTYSARRNAANGANGSSASSESEAATDVDGTTMGGVAGGDVVMTTQREPSVEQASSASRTSSPGVSRAQGAGMGAIAGALIGAATGRNVRSAVIGAAAGGVLGSVVVGRGIYR